MALPPLKLATVPTQGIQIGNAAIPTEGPKALPFLFDFNTATALQVDILYLFQQKLITVLQVLFVDNSEGNTPFTAYFSGTGQTIKVPVGAQGYFPILCPVNGVMTVQGSNPVGSPIQAYLINVPMSVLQWEPAGDGFLFTNTGALETADQGLAPFIDPTKGLQTYSTGSSATGENEVLLFAGSVANNQNVPAADAPGTERVYVTGILLTATGDAWGSATEIALADSGINPIFDQKFTLPAAAPATVGPQNILGQWSGLYQQPELGSRLRTDITGAVSGGDLWMQVWGYLAP